MESHLLDDLAVPLLSSLSRGTEGFSDLAPGDPGRPSCNDGVNDLTLTTRTARRGTLQEVLLDIPLVVFAGLYSAKRRASSSAWSRISWIGFDGVTALGAVPYAKTFGPYFR